jgi:hypothetical protein
MEIDEAEELQLGRRRGEWGVGAFEREEGMWQTGGGMRWFEGGGGAAEGGKNRSSSLRWNSGN